MTKILFFVFVLFLLAANAAAMIDVQKIEWEDSILKEMAFVADANAESLTVNFLSDGNTIDALVTTDFAASESGEYSLSTDKKIDGNNIDFCEFIVRKGDSDENTIINCGLKDKSYSDAVYYFSKGSYVSEVIYQEPLAADSIRDNYAETFIPGLQVIGYLFSGNLPVRVCVFEAYCVKEIPVIPVLACFIVVSFLFAKAVRKKGGVVNG